MNMFSNIIVDNVSFDNVNFMVDGLILIEGIKKQNNIEARINYCQFVIDQCKKDNEKYKLKIENDGNDNLFLGLKILENEERINVANYYLINC